ncbi:MAG: M1 family metallopeptidase [Acidobacteria bacterium]|nr:M1 family metallopeptidase [Acidobacteriota bacterium]
MNFKKYSWLIVCLFLAAALPFVGQNFLTHRDSGGVIRPTLEAYDVQHYALQVVVNDESQSIEGTCTITAIALMDITTFECDLDAVFTVHDVSMDNGEALRFDHKAGVIRADRAIRKGDEFSVTVGYSGKPVTSAHVPWSGGFVWAKTKTGEPWIGVACQGEGGDFWWPCKDDPADEPDRGMNIEITARQGLTSLSNGRLEGVLDNQDGTTTSRWHVSYPINTYLVTVNIGPYEAIRVPYHGLDGERDYELMFWALPEDLDKASSTAQQIPGILGVLGKYFGEYPYLEDKCWFVQTPFLGMEHQTLVAYGAGFKNNEYGFDTILLHELAHEWWGNKVSVSDWADFWIQEGFASYAEALYVEDTLGADAYFAYMSELKARIANKKALIQGDHVPASVAYHQDVYQKGAWVLHTLRFLVGDETFFEILHAFCNDPQYTHGNNVNTQDFVSLVERKAGKLDWFWKHYLHHAKPPAWVMERQSHGEHEEITLRWLDADITMPFPLSVGGEMRRLVPKGGRVSLEVPKGAEVVVDPQGWMLTKS